MSEIIQAIRVKDPKLLNRYFRRMAIILLLSGATLFFIWNVVVSVFVANAALNGIIVTVFFLGAYVCFRDLYRLKCDLRTLADMDRLLFEVHDPNALHDYKKSMYIMADLHLSLKNSIESDGKIPKIPTPVARSLVNVANNRFDERKAKISYLVNLLIYLGLLGTFIGLSTTVGSISGLISDLAAGLSGEEDMVETLTVLIKHLEHPLSGMGTAFGTSLTGLSCSVVLGAMSMNVNKASMLFSNIFSNWLYEYAMTSSRAIFAKNHQNQLKKELELHKRELSCEKIIHDAHPEEHHSDWSKVEHSLVVLAKSHTNQLAVLDNIIKNGAVQAKALQSIQKALDAQNVNQDIVNSINSLKEVLEPHIEPLQEQNKRLVELTSHMVTELQQQSECLNEQASQHNARHGSASDQRDKIIEAQEKTTSSVDKSNKVLAGINHNLRHMPQLSGEITSAARSMLKETGDALETKFDNQLQSGLREHQASVESTIKAERKVVEDTVKTERKVVEDTVKTEHKAIEDTVKTERKAIEDMIKTEQKANKTLFLRLFRTLHKLYQMIMRKQP